MGDDDSMNKRKINNAREITLQIQEALSQSEDAKYFHKLDLVLLTVNGMSSKEVASLYNEFPTTVSYWTKKAVESGVESLRGGKHTGRPSKLNSEQLVEIEGILRNPPTDLGYDMPAWDGILLSQHILVTYKTKISVRQCQRILRKLGFTLQRPQMLPSGGDDEQRQEYKKTK